MGKLLKGPSIPKPVVVDPPKQDDTIIQNEAAAERLRRQKAQGRQSTLVSSIADSTTDAQASVRKSTLLGG